MSESFPRSPESSESALQPPLSRLAIFSSPVEPDRAILRFVDIPFGQEHDISYLVSSEFFAHFAFQKWNASRPKQQSLQRYHDVDTRSIWLFGDDAFKLATVAEQAEELLELYSTAASAEDDFTPTRISYIEHQIDEFFAAQ
jgi:hypothetical protein